MHTRIRDRLRRRRWPRLAALLALAVLLATASAPSIAINQLQLHTSMAAAQPPTPSALPSPDDEDDQILKPFPEPVTETMTDTVRAVLASYTAMTESDRVARLQAMVVPNSGTLIYLPVIKVVRRAAPTPIPTPTPRPAKRADVAVTIWPSPSIIVIPGQTLTYEIRPKNYGKSEATSVRVTLPYTNQQLTVIDSRITNPAC